MVEQNDQFKISGQAIFLSRLDTYAIHRQKQIEPKSMAC